MRWAVVVVTEVDHHVYSDLVILEFFIACPPGIAFEIFCNRLGAGLGAPPTPSANIVDVTWIGMWGVVWVCSVVLYCAAMYGVHLVTPRSCTAAVRVGVGAMMALPLGILYYSSMLVRGFGCVCSALGAGIRDGHAMHAV